MPPPPADETPTDETPTSETPTSETPTDEARRYSPLVRRLADEFGVDLATVTGTGPGGRVTRHDVQRHAFGPDASSPSTLAHRAQPEGETTVEPTDDRSTFSASCGVEAAGFVRARAALAEAAGRPIATDVLGAVIAARALSTTATSIALPTEPTVGIARLTGPEATVVIVAAERLLADRGALADLADEIEGRFAESPPTAAPTAGPATLTVIDAGALGLAALTSAPTAGGAGTIAIGLPGTTVTVTGVFDGGLVDLAAGTRLLRSIAQSISDPIVAFAL